MRNLKRALSLAVAAVMVIGMTVIGTGASYDDVTSADNQEAIEVLQAVGIMTGDDQGNFNPDKGVTRAEMAVIMTKVLDLNTGNYSVSAMPFTDVPDWAKSYVAAIYAEGVTGGISDTLYGTDDPITAAQAGLMLMKALGYFQYPSDLADGWVIATVRQAGKINLYDGISAGTEEALTRNEVAQLVLNTLEATMVEPEGSAGGTITTGDTTITIGGSVKYNYRTSTDDNYKVIDGAEESTGNYYMELGEDLFEGKLKKDTTTEIADEFGRPGYTWTYEMDPVVFAAKEPVAVFNGKTSAADVAKALSGYKISGLTINNGADQTNPSTGDILVVNGGATKKAFGGDATETVAKMLADETANGMTLEFYEGTTDGEIGTIVQIKYSVGTVSSVSTNSSGTTYTVGGESGIVYDEDEDKDDTAVLAGSVDEDDVVTYVVAKNNNSDTSDNVLYIYPTTSFVGTQSAKDSKTITVSGTKYDLALGISSVTAAKFDNSDDDANYYVDQFGYIVYTDAVESDQNYAVVDRIALMTNETGTEKASQGVEARLVLADGTVTTVDVSKINGLDTSDSDEVANDNNGSFEGTGTITKVKMSTNYSANTALTGLVVTYAVDGDGEYELTYLSTTKGEVKGDGSAATTVVSKGSPAIEAGTSDYSGNNSTVYLIKTMDDDDEVFTSYTGIRNVPSVKTAKDDSNAVYVSVAKDGEAAAANAVVDFVYIDATKTTDVGDTETGDIFYVTGKDYATVGTSNKYYELTGILNGEEGTIRAKDSSIFSGLTENALYELKVDGDGYVTGSTKQGDDPDNDAYIKVSLTSDSQEASEGVIAGYTYDGTETVVVIDDDEVVGGSIESAKKDDTIYVKVVGDDGADAYAIDVIYIIKKA